MKQILMAALGLLIALSAAAGESVFQALPREGPKIMPELPAGTGVFSVSDLKELKGANGDGGNGNGHNEDLRTEAPVAGPREAIAVLNDPETRAAMPPFLRWILDQCGPSVPGWSHHPQQRKRGFNEKHFGKGFHCYIVEDWMGFRIFVEGMQFLNSVRGDTQALNLGGMYELLRFGDFGINAGVGVTHIRYEIPSRHQMKEGVVPLFSGAIDYKKKIQVVWVPIPNITGDPRNGKFFIVHFVYVRGSFN